MSIATYAKTTMGTNWTASSLLDDCKTIWLVIRTSLAAIRYKMNVMADLY